MMLALPEFGMSRSVGMHNVRLSVLCDWVEASVLFSDNSISKSSVVDALLENEVYDSQDFASEIVENAWNVLSARVNYLKSPLGLSVVGNRISKKDVWSQFPAYGFCMALACADLYPTWAKNWHTPHSVQGDYFEELAAESFQMNLTGWTIKRVGWSPTNPVKLKTTIHALISDLHEVEGAELDVHVQSNANELGLDLLAYYPFKDAQASSVVILIQCASGRDWVGKRHTPSLEIWKKVVNFNSQPLKGFVMPFAFAEQSEFRRQTTAVGGMFVDRNRLLRAFPQHGNSVSSSLNAKLVAWSSVEIARLPTDAA